MEIRERERERERERVHDDLINSMQNQNTNT